MKKLFILLLGIISFSLYFNYASAISVEAYSAALNKKLTKIETTEEKIKYLETLSTNLGNLSSNKDKNANFYKSIKLYTINLLKEIKSWEKNISSTFNKNLKLPTLSDNVSNIDEQKVRDAILLWHNEERYNVGTNPYTYNIDLEWSANTRANKLSNSQKITNLHLRNPWDWKYNYDSILNRFSDLWIYLPKSVKWGTSFSESIWYGFYKCNKLDCTQEIINSIKTTRTWLIMNEKNYNGSHYRAAIMEHFTQMWIWISIDKNNNRYYLVLHYAVNF